MPRPIFDAMSSMVKFAAIVLMVFVEQKVAAKSMHEDQPSDHHISIRSLPLWAGSLNETGPVKDVSPKLSEILTRIGPNMRSSSDYNDFSDISLNDSVLAWKMMHDQFENLALRQVDQYEPQVESLLEQAQVSDQCSKAIKWVLNSMRRLDSRAIQSK